MKEGEFSETTKRILAKRAGEKCSICSVLTSKPNISVDERFVNLGEAAHIKGQKLDQHNRYDPLMTVKERSHISNAIWLCKSCHKEIDSDSIKFTPPFLIETKRVHENKVYLGEFNIIWQYQLVLAKQVEQLEALLEEKEQNKNNIQQIHQYELNTIRLEIEKLNKEKSEFEQKLNQLSNYIATLNLDVPSENTTQIIEAFKRGEIELIKSLLDEEKLVSEEKEAAKKRVIKATILEIEYNYNDAETNYEKAYSIDPSLEILGTYTSFLKRLGKIDLAIDLCKKAVKISNDLIFLIHVNGWIGNLYGNSNRNKEAISHFKEALKLIQSKNPDSNSVENAKILTAIGISQKNIGEHQNALLSLQDALNELWHLGINNDIGDKYLDSLGILFNAIGLLYLETHNEYEALIYFNKALEIFSNEKSYNDNMLPLLYFNIVDVYNSTLYQNASEAQKYLSLAISILEKKFEKYPLHYLEYYIGCLTKMADNEFRLGNMSAAKENYIKSISIAEEFSIKHKINFKSLSVSYSNYGLFLLNHDFKEAIKHIDKAINLLASLDENEHERNLSLIKLYLLKAETSSSKEDAIKFLHIAKELINKCSIFSEAIVWKKKIELMEQTLS
jgi:tetratricopeptide (TPR) repeat protein